MGGWLPPSYEDAQSYFVDVIKFLHEYKWVFNWSVTHILIENVVHNIPPQWVSALGSLSYTELNELYSGRCEADWPESLKIFLSNCQKFHLPIQNNEYKEMKLSSKLRKGLSPKKEHEVVRLAALINSECSKHNTKFVLDIGSGLGYLCEVLHFEYGYDILGLETDPKRTLRALERHKEFEKSLHIDSSAKVSYSACHLSKESADDVEKELLKVNSNLSASVCMVGLHACGDLTSSAIHLFNQISQVKLLILLPCCYHRMSLKTSNEVEETFVNFPLSEHLQEAVASVDDCGGSDFIRRPLLRLAAQRASSAWGKADENYPNERTINTLATGSLYLLAHTEKATLKKKKRRPVRRSRRTSLNSFLADAIDRYELSTGEDDAARLTKLETIVNEHKQYLNHIGILLALQATLQPVVEGLVLADFIVKLKSCGYDDAHLLRLTDQVLSPRGVALIASKTNDR